MKKIYFSGEPVPIGETFYDFNLFEVNDSITYGPSSITNYKIICTRQKNFGADEVFLEVTSVELAYSKELNELTQKLNGMNGWYYATLSNIPFSKPQTRKDFLELSKSKEISRQERINFGEKMEDNIYGIKKDILFTKNITSTSDVLLKIEYNTKSGDFCFKDFHILQSKSHFFNSEGTYYCEEYYHEGERICHDLINKCINEFSKYAIKIKFPEEYDSKFELDEKDPVKLDILKSTKEKKQLYIVTSIRRLTLQEIKEISQTDFEEIMPIEQDINAALDKYIKHGIRRFYIDLSFYDKEQNIEEISLKITCNSFLFYFLPFQTVNNRKCYELTFDECFIGDYGYVFNLSSSVEMKDKKILKQFEKEIMNMKKFIKEEEKNQIIIMYGNEYEYEYTDINDKSQLIGGIYDLYNLLYFTKEKQEDSKFIVTFKKHDKFLYKAINVSCIDF